MRKLYDTMPNSGTFTIIDKTQSELTTAGAGPELVGDFKYVNPTGDDRHSAADASAISIEELAWLYSKGINVYTISHNTSGQAGQG